MFGRNVALFVVVVVSIWIQDTGYTHVEAKASKTEGRLIFILCIAPAHEHFVSLRRQQGRRAPTSR